MIHTIKNIKWVIATSLVCILLGTLTFFTFINKGFVELNEFNLQILLLFDFVLLALFFTLIVREIYKVLKERKRKTLGSQTSLKYITFFSITTLLPSILIAIFSLFLFNVILQKYFEKKIIIVYNKKHKKYLDKSNLKKTLKVIGGKTRQESTFKALKESKK